jgi:3-deoxy-D-manno-octulosonic-acid transferase
VYLIYSVATLVVLIALSPYFLYQALRHKKYVGSLRQRLGYLPVALNLDGEPSIWIHAVSVGEVLSTRPLIDELRKRYPQLRLYLSTTTRSGQQLAQRSVPDVDGIFYFPFDWAFTVRRTLSIVNPKLFVMVENEIWPTLLRECRRRGVRTVVVNGRISGKSFPRYRVVRPFFRRVLAEVDRFCVQGEETAGRLVALGAERSRITITGSMKFDALHATPLPGRGAARVLRFFRMSTGRAVLIGGSTTRGEEAAVIHAFNRVRTTSGGGNVLLVIAPRHPERFDEVERLCKSEGLSTMRRSELPIDAEPRCDAVILDTLGELAHLYQVATVVFVGGSLVPAGGHNILEPALYGKPVVFGPHMENFKEIADTFLSNRAALQVHNPRELETAIVALMGDPVRRARLGAAARALVDANRGANDRTLAVICDLFPPPEPARSVTVHPFRLVH